MSPGNLDSSFQGQHKQHHSDSSQTFSQNSGLYNFLLKSANKVDVSNHHVITKEAPMNTPKCDTEQVQILIRQHRQVTVTSLFTNTHRKGHKQKSNLCIKLCNFISSNRQKTTLKIIQGLGE
jgi:hypothetical protein